jgi:hypothetical protein
LRQRLLPFFWSLGHRLSYTDARARRPSAMVSSTRGRCRKRFRAQAAALKCCLPRASKAWSAAP